MSVIESTYRREANGVPITDWLTATKAITYVAGTTGATGAATLFTVTGDVVVRLFAKCTSDLTSGGSATIEAGISGNTAALLAQTAFSVIDAGEIWVDATSPATVEALPGQFILVGGTDIIQTIGTTTITGGVLTYFCLWTPLSEDGNLVAA